MERRFKLRGGELLALCAFAGILVFFSAPKAFGAEDLDEKAAPPINENTAASLEMITERTPITEFWIFASFIMHPSASNTFSSWAPRILFGGRKRARVKITAPG